jgi:hypothetical protein
MNRTQLAVAELLGLIMQRRDYARDPNEHSMRIYEAAEKVRQAQADDEYASWQVKEQPRCDAS